jgi:hypothetical protein
MYHMKTADRRHIEKVNTQRRLEAEFEAYRGRPKFILIKQEGKPMGYTDRARAASIRARGKMSNAVAADQLKYVLDMIKRCASIDELRKAIAKVGIVGPWAYEDDRNIPRLREREHFDRRRGQPPWSR